MFEIPKYDTVLFNAVSDAIDKLKVFDYGQARSILVQAQQTAEEEFLQSTCSEN